MGLHQLVPLAVALFFASGCGTSVPKPLAWAPAPTYAAPKIEEVVAHAPATLLQGEAAPWDGVLVDADDLNALLSEHQRLLHALQTAYIGRQDDRDYASKALESAQEALTVCRQNQPRTFLAGVAAGGAGCAAAVGIGAAAAAQAN